MASAKSQTTELSASANRAPSAVHQRYVLRFLGLLPPCADAQEDGGLAVIDTLRQRPAIMFKADAAQAELGGFVHVEQSSIVLAPAFARKWCVLAPAPATGSEGGGAAEGSGAGGGGGDGGGSAGPAAAGALFGVATALEPLLVGDTRYLVEYEGPAAVCAAPCLSCLPRLCLLVRPRRLLIPGPLVLD